MNAPDEPKIHSIQRRVVSDLCQRVAKEIYPVQAIGRLRVRHQKAGHQPLGRTAARHHAQVHSCRGGRQIVGIAHFERYIVEHRLPHVLVVDGIRHGLQIIGHLGQRRAVQILWRGNTEVGVEPQDAASYRAELAGFVAPGQFRLLI